VIGWWWELWICKKYESVGYTLNNDLKTMTQPNIHVLKGGASNHV
jgi:hypothetical protein